MKAEEINKVRIGDFVEINKGTIEKIDGIGYYDKEKEKVRIVESNDIGFAWWQVTNIFTPEENPEMYI